MYQYPLEFLEYITMWKSLSICLVRVKTRERKNERENGGEMCVWLRVERGRENGAAQQFSFQAHQNLILSGKKNMRENGELGFWMKLPSNVQIFIKSFFFFFFVFFLFAISSFQNLSFLFLCAHPFFLFLFCIFWYYHSFLFSFSFLVFILSFLISFFFFF